MGSEGGRWEASKNKSSKVLKARSASVVGGGLVVGIVTIVAVGVAGKLLSKFRKPIGLPNSTSTPVITPANSPNKIVNGDNPDLLMHVEDETQLSNRANINEKRAAESAAICLDLENGRSDDQNNTSSTTLNGEKGLDSISGDLHIGSPLGNIVDKNSSLEIQSDSGFTQDSKDRDESRNELSTTSAALSDLVNHVLLDSKDDRPSEHELLSKTKALQDGIKGAISRAIEDFSSCGGTSSDELTPTKLKLTVSWETNSSTGSEADAQVHPGELLAEKELLLPGSTEREAGEETIESVKHDVPAKQREEAVLSISLHSSSIPFKEKAFEPKSTTGGRNDMERGEQLLQEEETATFGGSEPANPKEVVREIQQEKIGLDGSLAPLPMKQEIHEVASLLDDTTVLSLTAKEASSDHEVVKKENFSQECAKLHTEDEIFKLNADPEAEICKLNSILLRSTNTSSTEITEADGDVDSVQISTEIAEEKEGTPVKVTSSLVLSATPHHESTVRKIVASKESAGAGGPQGKTTVVTTTVKFTSNTEEGLKRELRNKRGNPSSLEVLTLAVIIALIAALVWSMGTGTSFVRSL